MSASSSLSSDDQFDFLRTSNTEELEESIEKYHNDSAQNMTKTPMVKTPSMDALTRKYEFLLAQDANDFSSDDVNLEEGNGDKGNVYFETTPVLLSSKMEDTVNLGSQQSSRGSSRNSSRSATPTRRPVLTAQKILHRLQNGETVDDSQIPSSTPTWEFYADHHGQKQHRPQQGRYKAQLKQNLEQRLRQLDDSHTLTPPRPERAQQSQQKQQSSSVKRLLPFRQHSTKGDPPVQTFTLLKTNAPPSPSHGRLAVASSTTTATTMALTEAPSPAKTYQFKLHGDGDEEEEEEEEEEDEQEVCYRKPQTIASEANFVPVEESPSQNNNQGDSTPSELYRESSASFWHRWKMAEARLQQQQEEFEQEKSEWVRQLESAYSANAKVEALVKRYDVQLRAVHKTCLQQDGEDLSDDDEINDMPEEVPIDPLHLLLLRENGTDLDMFQWRDSDDSFEQERWQIKLQRRFERTRTKNVILSHLVKLLERQTEEQRKELEQQLKEEKEEKEGLWAELQQLQLQRQDEVLTPQRSIENKVSQLKSPPPSGGDQVKALQHRLWLREQQYEQERKEHESRIQTVQAECDRHKNQLKQHQPKLSPKSDKKVDPNLQNQLESLLEEKKVLQTERDALKQRCDQCQKQIADMERAQRFKELQQAQEKSHLESQLKKAQGGLQSQHQAQEKIKSLEEKMERLESKHDMERKEWELKLVQQGKRIATIAADSNANASKELQQKQRERWEAQLEATQTQAEKYHKQIEECRDRESRLISEKDSLAKEVERLQDKFEQMDHTQKEEISKRAEEHHRKLNELQLKFERDQQEYEEQLSDLRAVRDEKSQQLEHLQAQLIESNEKISELEGVLINKEEESELMQTNEREEISRLELSLKVERENMLEARDGITKLEHEICKLRENATRDHEASNSEVHYGMIAEKYDDLERELQKVTDDLKECLESLELETEKCKQVTMNNVALELEIQQLKKQYSEEKAEWNIIVDSLKTEKDARLLGSAEHQELLVKYDLLQEQWQQMKKDLDMTMESLRAEEKKSDEAKEKNFLLDRQLQQLNERFVQEMKHLEANYRSPNRTDREGSVYDQSNINQELEKQLQTLRRELKATVECWNAEVEKSNERDQIIKKINEKHVCEKEEWEKHLNSLRDEAGRVQKEFNEKKETLEFQVEELQRGLIICNTKIRTLSAKCQNEAAKRDESEAELEKVKRESAMEKKYLEDQTHHLLSNDSDRVCEMVEKVGHLERKLADAQETIDARAELYCMEAEKYKEMVENYEAREAEARKLNLEKVELERNLQMILDKERCSNQTLSERNTRSEQEIEALKPIHDKTLHDWSSGSAQNRKEKISWIQGSEEEMHHEKLSLQSKLKDSQQKVGTLQKQCDFDKDEWQQQVLSAKQEMGDNWMNEVEDLKREVLNVGKQLVFLTESLNSAANNRQGQDEILAGVQQIQVDMFETARILSQETQQLCQNRQGSDKAERSALVTAGEKQRFLKQQESIVQDVGALRLLVEGALRNSGSTSPAVPEYVQHEYRHQLHKRQGDLALAKDNLGGESEPAILGKHISLHDSVMPRWQMLTMQSGDESVGLQNGQNDTIDQDLILVPELDRQLEDLNKNIDKEMEEVRALCQHTGETDVVHYGEPTEAREAMLAQTSLLAQSLRIMMSDEDHDEEQQTVNVMQHLEVLSELMAEVDCQPYAHKPEASKSNDELVEVRMDHNETKGVFVTAESLSSKEGTDLLCFELAQDDSMLDLLHDESQEQKLLAITASHSTAAATGSSDENYFDLRETIKSEEERAETASPIQVMVEQTYNRCQLLERERCDLINVTLDLLTAAREANRAELDAALATARRRASEEMLQMKAAAQVQVDQLWCRLCEKCQYALMQGQ